jgi:cytochrome c oxidase subunit II
MTQTCDGGGRRAKPLMAVLYLLVVVLVLGAAYMLLRPVLGPARAVAQGSGPRVVEIEAYMSGFSQDTVEAKAGQPITIKLHSMDSSAHMDGGGKHQFAIDELGVNIIAPPKGWSEATFTPTKAGTYAFYCDLCCGGRANPTMQGKLVVKQ